MCAAIFWLQYLQYLRYLGCEQPARAAHLLSAHGQAAQLLQPPRHPNEGG